MDQFELRLDQPGQLERIRSGERFSTVRLNQHPEIEVGTNFTIVTDGQSLEVVCTDKAQQTLGSVGEEILRSEGVSSPDELVETMRRAYAREDVSLDTPCWVIRFST